MCSQLVLLSSSSFFSFFIFYIFFIWLWCVRTMEPYNFVFCLLVIVSAGVLQTTNYGILNNYPIFLYLLFTSLSLITKHNKVLQTSIHFSIAFLFLTSIAYRRANHGPKSKSEPSEVSVRNFSI